MSEDAMSKGLRLTVPLVLVAVLAFPQGARAGFADIIWEMSGPMLIGVGLDCQVAFRGDRKPKCRVLDVPLFLRSHEQPVWLHLEARGYFSTGKDADNVEFGLGRVWMVGLDPMIGFGGYSAYGVTFYHGAGVSLNRLFGPDFDSFGNWALKVRPVGVIVPIGQQMALDIAYNFRFYPDEFVASNAPSPAPLLRKGERGERVHGAVVSLRF